MQKPRNSIIAFSALTLVAAGVACLPAARQAHAQLSAAPDPVQYIVAPETPGPYQPVRIEVQGVGRFLGDSLVVWRQDGKTVLSDVGATTYSFTTGALGSQTRVQVEIQSSSQGTLTHTFSFTPALVNLVWEADTSAPPLYRGKSLYSAGSNVKVVAFPTVIINGARIAPRGLSFQWSRNDEPVLDQSGLGRAIFSFVGNQLQPQEDVAVDVYYGASKVAHGEVSIPASQPLLLLYAKDPLRGILYDSALPDAVSLTAKELTIQAAPYFFSNASLRNGALVYKWTLNGEDAIGPDSAKGMLTLRQAGNGQGEALVEAELQNHDADKLVQAAGAALRLVFGQTSSNSLFGL